MALNTYRQYAINNANTSKALEKLSSGLRINRAGDDAAGLAISEKMRAQIRGLNQASRNVQHGISMIQTAEGGLSETHSILQRMRELATKSASDTNDSSDRVLIQQEIDMLAQEITEISNHTNFNGHKLLNGGVADSGLGQMNLQIGADAGQSFKINIDAMDAKTLGVSGDGPSVSYGTNINAAVAGTPSYATDPGEAIKFTFTEGTPHIPAVSAQSAEIVASKSSASDLKAALAASSSTSSIQKTDGGNIVSSIAGSPAYAAVDGETINLSYIQGSPAVLPAADQPATLSTYRYTALDMKTALEADVTTTSIVKTDGGNVVSNVDWWSTGDFFKTDGEAIKLTYIKGSPAHQPTTWDFAQYTGLKAVAVNMETALSAGSDAQLRITSGDLDVTISAYDLRHYNNDNGVQNVTQFENLLVHRGVDAWIDSGAAPNWGIQSDYGGASSYITLTVTGSSAAEKSAIETLASMTGDTVTVYGTDTTTWAPPVDSTLTISDNHSHSDTYAVNDADTSFSFGGYFDGLNVDLAAGKTLADLTGNASSTVSYNNVTTTTGSDAQLKITVDGASTIITAAEMRSYNSGAGVQTAIDLYNILDAKGVNVSLGPFPYTDWLIESQNKGASATVSVEVTGSSVSEKEAIEALMGMSSDSVTVEGLDATLGTPKVDSKVTVSDNNGHSQDIVVSDSDTSLTGSGYFTGLNVSLASGITLSDLNGGAASALSFNNVTTTTAASDAQLKVTVDGAPTVISAAEMRNYNSGVGVQTGDDLYQLLQSKGVNVTSGGGTDPNWKIESPDQASSATVSVAITGSSASEKSAIRALLGISGDNVTVHGQDAISDKPAVSSNVTISDNNGHSEVVLVNDSDSSFTGTGYFSDLSVNLVSGKMLSDLTGDPASTFIVPGGSAPAPKTASAAQFTNHVLVADATCVAGIDISTQPAASTAITAIDNAINTVSTQRASLGAMQNRLDHRINSLSSTSENLSAAESRICDADMASEMTTYAKNNILVQAAMAMLSQANQAPQNVLQLLK